MALATIPGYPRIGRRREMKRALEGYWSGKLTESHLRAAAAAVRQAGWDAQRAAGLDLLPVNDFSFYDHVLDTAALVGAVPARYGSSNEPVDLDTLFAMARGRAGDRDARAMEMTKWFDTNYHYIVPELGPDTPFRLAADKPFAELAEARTAGVPAKVTLLGPITFLLLGKAPDGFATLDLLDRLLPVYADVLERLAAGGADWIQLDEPALVMDRSAADLAAVERAYAMLAAAKGSARLLVQTAYGHVGEAYQTLVGLPVDGVGLDLVRGRENLALIERHGFPADKWLAAGVVDGRNVWINDLTTSLQLLDRIADRVPVERLMVSTSSSLLHVPLDVRLEEQLDPDVRSWLAFAEQKLDEVVTLTRALNEGREAVAERLELNQSVLGSRDASPRRRNPAVRERLAALSPEDERRPAPYAERMVAQRTRLDLPPLPTTTIGSFPQTVEVRAERRRFERGEIDVASYERFVEGQIRQVIAEQEQLGLDVLVHGEFERNDMVQYFGEQLSGFAFTKYAWVQSYGSRCVRPPIIFGDVSRPDPMTVAWWTYAQSLTGRPMKGMLTGPVTILNWSFVRDDQPRSATCRQIAFAIRDEVVDLERAGAAIIQIDEAALREGLPLRRGEWQSYLDWAVECFRITASGVADATQIHTHMCYSEFNDIIASIGAMDADVISIETARSQMELLDAFAGYRYPAEIVPGVYDIHSPRVPAVGEMTDLLGAAARRLPADQLWVNPDCGLKTRKWPEVRLAIENMVAAAQAARVAA